MSMRKCCVSGCPHWLREGLRRQGVGGDGQELADGRTCWRCRARQAREAKKDQRRDEKQKAPGSAGTGRNRT